MLQFAYCWPLEGIGPICHHNHIGSSFECLINMTIDGSKVLKRRDTLDDCQKHLNEIPFTCYRNDKIEAPDSNAPTSFRPLFCRVVPCKYAWKIRIANSRASELTLLVSKYFFRVVFLVPFNV
jgi:hypothetical protein